MIFAESTRPSFASFLMSVISFFSCRSSAPRSRSISRIERLMFLLYSFIFSAGVLPWPKSCTVAKAEVICYATFAAIRAGGWRRAGRCR